MDIVEKMQKEWELTTLLLVFLLIFIFGVFGIMKLFEEETGGGNGNSALPASPHFFDMNSLAYLEPAKLPEVVNPLAYRHSLIRQKPKPTPPPEQPKGDTKTQPKGDGKQQAQTPQQPKTGNAPAAQPTKTDAPTQPTKTAPPPPPKPKRKIKLLYSGYSSIEGGSEKAWVSATEEKAKKRASGRFEKGAKLLDAVQIVAFDADKMVIQHSGSQQVTIAKGKNNAKEVTVE